MYEYVNIIISNLQTDNNKSYTYKVDTEKYNISIGDRVIVPFGGKNNTREGYVVAKNIKTNLDPKCIKEIIGIPDDFSLFNKEMFALANFMSEKYTAGLAECLNVFMPKVVRNLKEKDETKKSIMLTDEADINIDEILDEYSNSKSKLSRYEVLKYIVSHKDKIIYVSDLMNDLNISDSPIKTLEKNGIVEIKKVKIEKNIRADINIKEEDVVLTNNQIEVYHSIKSILERNSFDEFLLKGVTGSGKTEVYIKAAEDVIKSGKTVIILVPEIGLTPQLVERFKNKFENISIMHSKLSAGEKYDEWKKVKDSKADVVIGPRSAIFMPLSNLGLIIIDEEHEMTYKSEFTPKYKTSEVARFRAKYNNAVLISASATPSIETYYRALKGDIRLLELTERFNEKELPKINVVDMKKELEEGNKSIFSAELQKKIYDRLKKKEQVILFLNRRGYSTFVSCRKCGHVMKCPNCSVPYVYHQNTNSLECHYCFSKTHNVSVCPKCGSKYIKHFGIGTEKIEDEIKKLFGNVRVLRMDKDTTSKKGSHEEIINAFKRGEADILIGTQMIAKGHNFNGVTLVGIIAADAMINMQDFRAPEKAFQIIVQVSGRAGRAEKEGEVCLQTYEPDNYALKYASTYDYDGFYKEEMKLRRIMNSPPFRALFYIMFLGEDENYVKGEISKLKKIFVMAKESINSDIEILGPGPNTINKLNNMYRWQIILRDFEEENLRKFAQAGIKKYKEVNKNTKILIQINFD